MKKQIYMRDSNSSKVLKALLGVAVNAASKS